MIFIKVKVTLFQLNNSSCVILWSRCAFSLTGQRIRRLTKKPYSSVNFVGLEVNL